MPTRDPFAPGHEEQTPPEVYAVRPDGGGPDTPGWTVRVVPNLYPALTPDAAEPEPHANPDLFTAQPAAGHHEVIVNAPDSVTALSDLDAGQVQIAMEAWRARMRAHADMRLPPPHRQRAPRGRRLAPTYARAALRAALRAGRDRARARALHGLCDAHDGR